MSRRRSGKARVALVGTGFALMSCVSAFALLVFVDVAADPTNNAGVIVFAAVLLLGILGTWLASLRSLRRRLRPPAIDGQSSGAKPVRRGRGRIATQLALTFRGPSPPRNVSRGRTGAHARQAAPAAPLTIADVRATQRLAGPDRQQAPTTANRAPAKPIRRLTGIERTIGEALYQLDQAPN